MYGRPIELHVSSRGEKLGKFQEALHSEEKYWFLPVDGTRKTQLYNARIIDGRKRPVKLYSDFMSAVRASNDGVKVWVFAIERSLVTRHVDRQLYFHGILELSRTYLMRSQEATEFYNTYCSQCELVGTAGCFRELECFEAEREKFVDGPWREKRKSEAAARRKSRVTPAGREGRQSIVIA